MAYYIEHVYFSKLPAGIHTTTSPGPDKESGYQLLARLYALVERMLDSNAATALCKKS